MTFRYTLDSSPRKFLCPSCLKRRFVRYVNIETGEYMDNSSFGRCDSQSSCGYIKTVPLGTKANLVKFKRIKSISPKSFAFTDLWNGIDYVPKSQVLELGNGEAWVSSWFVQNSKLEPIGEPKYFNDGLELVNEIIEAKGIVAEPKEPSYHDPKLLKAEPLTCNLTRFLYSQFPQEEVNRVKELYKVKGTHTPWKDSTIYYQIDLQGRIRGGKILHYATDGKRTKDPYPRINWMHKILNIETFNLDQCLYGLHLAKQFPNKEIRLMESEKACLIMTLRQPHYNWMATGSLSGLKPTLLEVIKDRPIKAFPDKGSAYIDWMAKAEEMNTDGYNITVSPILESTNLPDGSGLDDLKI